MRKEAVVVCYKVYYVNTCFDGLSKCTENIGRGSAQFSKHGIEPGISLYEGGLEAIPLRHMGDSHTVPT